MLENAKPAFDADAYFLASAGIGRRIVKPNEKQNFFSQGEAADSIFYLQSGRARLTVTPGNPRLTTFKAMAKTAHFQFAARATCAETHEPSIDRIALPASGTFNAARSSSGKE